MMGLLDVLEFASVTIHLFGKIAFIGLITFGTVGKFIFKCALMFLTCIYSAFTTIFDVVKVLYEDYCVFLKDVFHKTMCVLGLIGSTVEFLMNTTYICWEGTKNICAGIYETTFMFLDTIYSITLKLLHSIQSVPELVKYYFILVGSGIWLTLKLIPLGFVYTISMCVFMIGRSFEEILSIVSSTSNGILYAVYAVFQFLHDIPMEAQGGIILGMCLLYAALKYQHHIKYCFSYFCSNLKYALVYVWTSLEILLLSLFMRQTIEPRNVDAIESDDSSDDTESVVDRTLNDALENPGSSSCSSCFSQEKQNVLYQLEQEHESKLCVVCQDRNKSVIILPCRHLCLCTICCKVIQREYGICPICRQNVRRTMEIYV